MTVPSTPGVHTVPSSTAALSEDETSVGVWLLNSDWVTVLPGAEVWKVHAWVGRLAPWVETTPLRVTVMSLSAGSAADGVKVS